MTRLSRPDILTLIVNERENQLNKWGEQHHPDGTWEGYANVAQSFRLDNDKYAQEDKRLTWTSILLEEVYEALTETKDPKALERELIQVAAVCVAWLEDMKSRRGGNGS